MTKLADLVATKDVHELIIYGDKGSGKSFLMQAICNELGSAEKHFTCIQMHQAIKINRKSEYITIVENYSPPIKRKPTDKKI